MTIPDIKSDPLISIVVALYNEEAVIPAFFAEVNRTITAMQARVEIVCVNDGSRDRTLNLLRDRLQSQPGLRIVNLARNFGKEAALTAGLAEARGDAVIVIDADLQDPPSLIPKFISKWHEGYDVVYGVRSSRPGDDFFKRWTASGFYALFNKLTDVQIPAGTGDFRLMDRRVVDAILALPERNRFSKGLFAWVGFRQTGVEFMREVRVAGSTGWSYLRLFNLAIDGLTSFSIAPLRIASVVGILTSLIGFVYTAFLTVRTILLGIDVPGYASLMVVIMILGGVQLICLGLIGEYLGRLYIEAKGRPLYIVSEILASAEVPEHPVPNSSVGHTEETTFK